MNAFHHQSLGRSLVTVDCGIVELGVRKNGP
jgi:hypothetical protein